MTQRSLLRLASMLLFLYGATFSVVYGGVSTLESLAVRAVSKTHISRVPWQGQWVWVKGIEPRKRGHEHCLKKYLLQKILPAIAAPTVACGKGLIALEKARLEAFQAHGVRVPKILAAHADWLVLSDLGEGLEGKVRWESREGRRLLLQKGLAALIDLHARGLIHGRPVLRDLVITPDGGIGFLDLVEDAESMMTFEQARLRDLWLYVYGAWPFIREDPQGSKQLIMTVWRQLSPDQQKNFRAQVGASWIMISCLKPLWPIFSGDARKFLELLKVLHHILPPC